MTPCAIPARRHAASHAGAPLSWMAVAWLGLTPAAMAGTSVAGPDPAAAPVSVPPLAPEPDGAPLYTDAGLQALVDQAVAASPELARVRAVLVQYRERVPQAGVPADPWVQVGLQNDGFQHFGPGAMEDNWVSFMASQSMAPPGRLRAERATARADLEAEEPSLDRALRSTRADVQRAWVELVLTRDRMALQDTLDGLWRQALGAARSRYEVGAGAQTDLLRVQLEIARLAQRRVALVARERALVQALNGLRAHAPDEPVPTPVHLADLPGAAALQARVSIDRALADSPELRAAHLGSRSAERRVASARRARLPELVVGAGLMARGGEFPPMWTVSLGGPLPVFSAARLDRAAAEGRALGEAARAGAVALERTLRLRAEQRRSALQALAETEALYAQGLLIQSSAVAESALAQYSVGRVSFGTVVEATAGVLADHEGWLQTRAAAQRVAIDDEALSLAAPALTDAGMPGTGVMAGSGGPLPAGRSPGGGAAPDGPGGVSNSSMGAM